MELGNGYVVGFRMRKGCTGCMSKFGNEGVSSGLQAKRTRTLCDTKLRKMGKKWISGRGKGFIYYL